MKIEQIYTGCLSQGAYYLESRGEVAIIDPLRETGHYIEKATNENAHIKYVLETHFHADFVSGHLDLARNTGASIVYGPLADPAFDAHIATDGEELTLGDITIKVLHTPGHTLESTCYLVLDEAGKAKALFSGDTLFIGDVGRPDLAQKTQGLTIEQMAGMLFDSLAAKVIPLPGEIIIYPAHGAGSSCGKNMSSETTDTLAHQKATNYALRPGITKQEFVKETTLGLAPPPAYFPLNVLLNKTGCESIDQVVKRGITALSPDAFEQLANHTGALLLDTRAPDTFQQGFIPNSINIGIDGNFAPWAGTLIPDVRQAILIVADPGREEEVITRLARVGLDQSIGYLCGGFEAWRNAGKETDSISFVTAAGLADEMKSKSIIIFDVRKKNEYDDGHIAGSVNMPLNYINGNMTMAHRQSTTYLHCASGYRSVIFISILKARGYHNLVNVTGGFKAIKESARFQLTQQP